MKMNYLKQTKQNKQTNKNIHRISRKVWNKNIPPPKCLPLWSNYLRIFVGSKLLFYLLLSEVKGLWANNIKTLVPHGISVFKWTRFSMVIVWSCIGPSLIALISTNRAILIITIAVYNIINITSISYYTLFGLHRVA